MAGVGASPHQWGAAFDGFQHGVRVPIVRRLGMIVDGHLDVVLLAELLDGIEGRGLRLRHQRVNAHLLGELEHFPALCLRRGAV